ncbi:MAG: hypothetical protein ACTHQM_25565 [Thermoanaerobaculia bacterium]
MNVLRLVGVSLTLLLALVAYQFVLEKFRFPFDFFAAVGISLLVLTICRK